MNDVDDFDAVGEGTLRRALRLEADERPPRLDAAALAVAAGRHTALEQLRRVLRGVALVGVSLGVEAVIAVAAFNVLGSLDLTGVLSVGLDAVTSLAVRLFPVAELAASPSIAVATLAAVLFAIAYERSSGRESVRVHAS